VINAEKFFTLEDFNKCLDLFGEELEHKSFYQRMWKLKRPSTAEERPQVSNDENQVASAPKILTLESLRSALDKRKGKQIT
jgi:hypothetical protein